MEGINSMEGECRIEDMTVKLQGNHTMLAVMTVTIEGNLIPETIDTTECSLAGRIDPMEAPTAQEDTIQELLLGTINSEGTRDAPPPRLGHRLEGGAGAESRWKTLPSGGMTTGSMT
mmetsp:Transcript_5101/g.18319  ORF Transcript_5101/g.18319 Transcript_5101/m.18319 type:complete len:117 (-) Transcript_5101:564-914(-)